MTLLGAPGDTWGIAGQRFALLYLLGAIVVVTGVVLWRRAITAGPVERPEPLNPSEWAYLAGGSSRATASALAALRMADSVRTGPGGRLEATGPMPRVTRELDRAVYSAATRRVTLRALADDPSVSSALERVRAELVQGGWLLDEGTRRRSRLASLPVFGLVLVGVARLAAGVQNGKPVGFLVVELSAVVVAQLLLLRAPPATRAARKLLDGQRRSSRAGRSPSWAAYGMSGAAAGAVWGGGGFDGGGGGGGGGDGGGGCGG